MKTFEELYTAWIDGRLAGAELERFERELPDRAAAEADRAEAQGLGQLLRTHGHAPELSNSDFFSHQLLERIAADERKPEPAPRRGFFFGLPQMAWAGGCFLLLATGLYFATVPAEGPAGQTVATITAPARSKAPVHHVHDVPVLANFAPAVEPESSVYEANIIEAKAMEPGVSATSVYSKAENMTVLWLDGLEYLPASYSLQ